MINFLLDQLLDTADCETAETLQAAKEKGRGMQLNM